MKTSVLVRYYTKAMEILLLEINWALNSIGIYLCRNAGYSTICHCILANERINVEILKLTIDADSEYCWFCFYIFVVVIVVVVFANIAVWVSTL